MASDKNQDYRGGRCGSITGETYLYQTNNRRRRNTLAQRDCGDIDESHPSKSGDISRFSSFDSTTQNNNNNNNHHHHHNHNDHHKQQENHPQDREGRMRNPSSASSSSSSSSIPKSSTRFNQSFHHYRFIVVMMGGFSFGLMILLRFNISVAILNMVNQTALYLEDNPDKTVDDFLDEGYSLGGEFLWDNEIQQMIMSLYMFAYTLPQVFTTKLGLIMGNRWAIPISLTICGLSTLFTPMAAYQGWRWVVALRLANGIGASAVLPLMLNLIETWMPYDEMTLGLTCAQILQASLVTLNPLISGQLSAIHWSYAFYLPAIITLVYSLVWLLLVANEPEDSWLISQQELDLICGLPKECNAQSSNNNKQYNEDENENENENDDHENEYDENQGDWKQVFGIPSFYAYIFMWCLYCSTYNSFSFILPNYLRQFLKISVADNGIFCTIIQSGCIVSVLWPHPMMEALKTRFKISDTGSRRATYVLISLMVSGTWIYVGLFHESQLLLLFINRCFQSSTDIVVTGSIMANFAKAGLSGLVFSMVNTIGNLSVVFASPTIGRILDMTGQSREGWSWIYSAMGCSQWFILLPFSTMIRSEPIEFKRRQKKSVKGSEKRIDSDVDLEQGKGH